MKNIILTASVASACILFPFFSSAQDAQKDAGKLWWEINQSCFYGTNITKFNGLFMSTANKLRATSIFKLEKNPFTKITDKHLIYSNQTMAKLAGFPKVSDSLSATPPCSFKLDYSNSASLEVYGKLVDQANIGSINAELQSILRSAKTLSAEISRWGIEYVELGAVQMFITDELAKKNKLAIQITDGSHYFSHFGVWVEGLKFSYELNKETVNKVKVIYESNKEKFASAGVSLNFSSETSFTTSLEFKDRFYPFLKFVKITKSGDLKIKGNSTNAPVITLEEVFLIDLQD